jgi:hypothetical protein
VFNVRVGSQEKEWDTEGDLVDQASQVQSVSEFEENGSSFDIHQEAGVSPLVNYPMYIPPFSPLFEQPQQDPYQVQASFQMLGSPYTDSPVYAGTPCGQINLSPEQTVFPFNTYPLESTTEQNPLSPQEYGRSQPTYFSNSMDQSPSNMASNESFAMHTTPPDISDIPADYVAFDGYHMDYHSSSRQDDPDAINSTYPSNLSNQDSYQSFEPNNDSFTQSYHAQAHQPMENMSNSGNGMYTQSQHQYPLSNQDNLNGKISYRFPI